MTDRKISITMSLNDLVSGNLQKISTSTSAAMKGFDNMESSTKKAAGGLESINKVLKAGLALWGARQALSIVGDLNEMGVAARNASDVFIALQGSSAQANETLSQLRGATMGVVDDFTLMASSNRLMQMGLANTNDDLVRFTEMAVKLGRAMGQDVNSALENFALMVSNKSYLRLDTYGISAGAVRDRVKELKEETDGLSTEQAFLLATLEQGDLALQRIEGTLATTGTAAERLGTRLENIKIQLGETVAYAIEAGAQLTEIGTGFGGEFSGREIGMGVFGASPDEIREMRDARLEYNNEMERAIKLGIDMNDVWKQEGGSPLFSGEYDVQGLRRINDMMAGFEDAWKSLDVTPFTEEFGQEMWRAFQVTGFSQSGDLQAVFDEAFGGLNIEMYDDDQLNKMVIWYNQMTQEAERQVELERERNEALKVQEALLSFNSKVEETRAHWQESAHNTLLDWTERHKAYLKQIQTYTDFTGEYSDYTDERRGLFNVPGDRELNALENLSWQREKTEELTKQFALVEKAYEKEQLTTAQYEQSARMLEQVNANLETTEALARGEAQTTLDIFTSAADMVGNAYSGGQMGQLAGIDIMSEGSAELIDTYTERAAEIYNEMERMHELDLISDDDMAGAEAMMDNMREMSEKAWDAANAIDKMNLDQLLGRQGGGVVGEFGDAITAYMQEQGFSDEDIQAAADAFAMESGRETAFGRQFETEIVPMFADLTDELGAEEAARLAKVASETLVQARKLGYSDEQIMAMIENATGYGFGGGGTEFAVLPGDTPESVARRYGISTEQVMAAAGDQYGYIHAGGYSGGTATGMQGGAGAADTAGVEYAINAMDEAVAVTESGGDFIDALGGAVDQAEAARLNDRLPAFKQFWLDNRDTIQTMQDFYDLVEQYEDVGLAMQDSGMYAGPSIDPNSITLTGEYATGGGAHALSEAERLRNEALLAGESLVPPAVDEMSAFGGGEAEGISAFGNSMENIAEAPFEDMNSFLGIILDDKTSENSGLLAENLDSMAISMEMFPEAAESAGMLTTEMAGWKVESDLAKTSVQALMTYLDESLSKPKRLKLVVDVMGGGAVGGHLDQVVKDNGGIVPGADARSGTGPIIS